MVDLMDKLEVVYESQKVAINAVHGPIHFVVSLTPSQAEEVARLLIRAAKEARA
jgi:hypothetical protein